MTDETPAGLVSGWVLPMLRSLPHRVSARLRENDRASRKAARARERRRDRPELLARKSMGFNSLTDMSKEELEGT